MWYSLSPATASKLHMDTATPPRQSLASTMEMTSQRRSSISSQVWLDWPKHWLPSQCSISNSYAAVIIILLIMCLSSSLWAPRPQARVWLQVWLLNNSNSNSSSNNHSSYRQTYRWEWRYYTLLVYLSSLFFFFQDSAALVAACCSRSVVLSCLLPFIFILWTKSGQLTLEYKCIIYQVASCTQKLCTPGSLHQQPLTQQVAYYCPHPWTAVSPLCTGKLTNYRPVEKEKRLPVRCYVLK